MRSGAYDVQTTQRKAVWGAAVRLAGALLLVLTTSACGQLQRESGTGSSYLIVNALQASTGDDPEKVQNILLSDVVTVVKGSPTIYNDLGVVTFSLGLKDPGTATSPSTPTSANYITVDRYHVQFVRADGRNTPGVDVPYAFDGGMTVTVTGDKIAGAFTLVRHDAKAESPLAALASNFTVITTIAKVTFYGHDQTGRETTVTANITVDFGNFADKVADTDSGS
jgi:hypothetical protein